MQGKQHKTLNMTQFAWASLVPVCVMIAAMVLKPLWRDEYWTLFFADPSLGFGELISSRQRDDIHPPLFYWVLHLWLSLLDSHFAARALSVLMLLATALGIKGLTRPDEMRALYIFLLTCLGSYWVIYFTTEIRGYVMLFCSVTMSIFVLRRIYDAVSISPLLWALWILIGAGMALTHYFGALWFSCLSFVAGIAALKQGSMKKFVAFGVFAVLALLPVLGWLAYSLPHVDLGDEQAAQFFLQKLEEASNQYFRGLLVKTFASNPVITFLGFGALIAAVKGRGGLDSVLIWAALLTTIIAFILHLGVIPLIKERAFIVIMPAILFIFASGVDLQFNHKAARFIPVVVVIMPFIFMSEYFKDREKIGPLRDYLAPYSDACSGQPILVYYRPSDQAGFYPEITADILDFKKDGHAFMPIRLDVNRADTPPETDCPVKAAAFFLRRGQDPYRADAIKQFERAGLDVSSLEEVAFGKSRNIIWVEK